MQLQSGSSLPEGVEQRIANLYAPNLSSCWGVECVQVGAKQVVNLPSCGLLAPSNLPDCTLAGMQSLRMVSPLRPCSKLSFLQCIMVNSPIGRQLIHS